MGSSKQQKQKKFWWQDQRRMSILLFVLSLLLYANTFGHEYAQDDAIAVFDNKFTTQGIAGIPSIFSHDTFYGYFFEEGKEDLVAGGRYRPFSLAVLAIEYQIFGDNPTVFHIFNSLWYGLTVVVLYWLLLQLFRRPKRQTSAFFIALAAALIFLVHPVHTEAVANIKGRDEIFTLLGGLLAIYFGLRAYREENKLFLVWASLAYFMALLSKENAITLLAVIPLSFYYFTDAKWKTIISYSLPYLGVAILFIAIRTAIIGFSLGETPIELMNNPFVKIENNQWVHFSTSERLASIFTSLLEYLRLLVFPHPLSHDYYPYAIEVRSWADWRPWTGLLLHLGIAYIAISGLRKKKTLSYAAWFYLATISIFSNILFPIGTNLSERFLFMPSIAFAIAVALLAKQYLANTKKRDYQRALMAVAVLAIIFAARTIIRNPIWKNNYTLFTHDIEVQPNSAKLRNAVGGELITQAARMDPSPERTKMLNDALGHLDKALQLHPTYQNAYFQRCRANYLLDRFDAAIAECERALDYKSDDANAVLIRNYAYRDGGKYFGEKEQNPAKALNYLLRAYELMPEDYETIRLLGVAYGVSGNHSKAIEFFTRNTDANPDNASAWLDLASAYFASGQEVQGQNYLQRARSIDPEIEAKRMQANQQ